MIYLIGQILLCLILAALLGFIIGWLLKGFLMRRKIKRLEKECMQKLDFQEEEFEKLRSGGGTDVTTPSEKDDLKKISGVGPFLEDRLNLMGIYTYRQIAEFTNDDIDRISDKIGPFPSRIVDDEWVKQAKQLHKEKYNETI